MKRTFAVFASILCTLSSSWAAETPTKGVIAYYEALKSQDFEGAVKTFDPSALKEFREILSFMKEMDGEGQTRFLRLFFGPGASKESVAKLSDEQFFAAFFKRVMSKAATSGVGFEKIEVLGEVPEGADVVHVLARTSISSEDFNLKTLDVMSFKKSGDGWRAMLSSEMTGMAEGLRKTFARENE